MKLLKIEKLKPSLIKEVVEIHIQSLPNDFLPSLGADFLMDGFYPAVINSEYGRAYAALQNDRACGFIIVTKDSSRFFKSIIKNQLWRFIKVGLKTSFSSATQFQNNLNIILSALKENVKDDYGEIYEIAVKKTLQGRGVGRELVEKSIEYLKNEGIQGIKIKTQKDNVNWINSLKKNGWRIINEFKLIGRDYVILCREIG